MIEYSDKPASRCGALMEAIAERYPACQIPGVDIEGAKRELARYKAMGLITVLPPLQTTVGTERRKWTANQKRAQAAEAEKSMLAEAKLDRVVAEVRSLGDRFNGDFKGLAEARGVDYRRLLNRVRGRTKTSRM